MLIPAGFVALSIIGALGNTGTTDDPVDTTSDLPDPEIVAPATTDAPVSEESTTTEASTTTAELPPLALASVTDRALSEARSHLESTEKVPAFAESPRYVRDSYTGGGWPDSDGDCQSDRHEILIEESLIEVVLDEEGCRVESGLWVDAFDGTEYTDAKLVTIDHMVPLAAAHRAGAWQWDDASKQAFASDIAFGGTHIAVGAEVNQAKGDQGPEAWRPELESSWCAYAVDWISVKARWELAITEAEAEALGEMLDGCETVSGINSIASNIPPVSPTVTTPTTTTTTTTTTATTTTTTATTTTTTATTTTAATTTTVATTTAASNCHPNYEPCVPNVAGDLNCDDIGFSVRVVGGRDPYGLDGNDNDGLGCESY